MAEPDTNAATATKPGTSSVPKYEFFTLLIAIVGIGIALGTMLFNATGRIDSAIAEAAADRRAFQASMDEYRRDMQRLGERQARLEGQREGAPRQ